MKYLFRDYSEKGRPDAELMSVTQNQGVVPRTWVENRMVMPSGSLESFKFIRKGDFAISLRSFEGGLEYCHHDGIISPAYTVLKLREDLNADYYKFLLKSPSFISEIQTSVVGIREGKNISYPELSYSLMPIPSRTEQTAIANFLDRKTALIDQAIAQKERLIELLRERQQLVIQQAVTRGLDPDVPMKDSGVEWIGEVPELWEVRRAKYLLSEIDERSENGEEELLSVSHVTGVTPRSEKNITMFQSESYAGSKLSRRGDLVINTMWAWMGALGISDRIGIVSPSYGVYRVMPKMPLVPNYLELLLKHPSYIAEYNRISTGLHSSRLRLYPPMVMNLPIVLPPNDEQSQIVTWAKKMANTIDQAVNNQTHQIDRLKEYRATLIDAAVTGKIKVEA